jgi:3-dehydroquinate synthase
MARTVRLDLGLRSYDILIGSGLLPHLGDVCPSAVKGRSCLLVTDATVAALYGDACAQALARMDCQVGRAIVPAGEASKDSRWLFHLYDKGVEQGLDRRSFVVALGGGVVGDLAGFMAASFLRGLALVQVPTTLLAMVDSAVGGKTGINLPQGKNLVGAFHQPALVVCDLDVLKTLPRRELVAGLAEVIKYGVIKDPELIRLIEHETDRILAGDPAVLETIVARSCEIKAEVVGHDEREESGLRAILNFGHTIGHAIEAVSGYGQYLHGEAIAIGMAYAARLSVAQRGLHHRDCDRLIHLLAKVGLPVDVPAYPWQQIRRAVGVDKKNAGGKPRFVLVDRLGAVASGCEVDEEVLQQTWETRYTARGHGFG